MVLVVKNPPANAGDGGVAGLIPGLGRSSGEEHGSPLQYLAWRIPWTEEPGRLQSIGSQRIIHDWSDWACKAHPTWRRSWQWKSDLFSKMRKKVVFSPFSVFLWLENCSLLSFQHTVPSNLPACKPHKCPILTNHFLSIIMPLAKTFLHWDIKNWSSLEAPNTPPGSVTIVYSSPSQAHLSNLLITHTLPKLSALQIKEIKMKNK